MAFVDKTRLKNVLLETKSKPTGGGLVSWTLPKTGILQKMELLISITISGTLSAQNVLGVASVINRVQLTLNTGVDLVSMSGAGYAYLLSDMLYDNRRRGVYNELRSAVTAASFVGDIIVPAAINDKDELGLIMLQFDSLSATLNVTFEADAVVATGATVTATVTPSLWLFEPPSDPADLPVLNVVQRVIETSNIIAAGGSVEYEVARGGTLLGVYGLVYGTTWSTSQLILQGSNIIENHTNASMRAKYDWLTGQNIVLVGALAGGGSANRIFYDFAGSDGLGTYGTQRDVLNTRLITDLKIRNTYASAGNYLSMVKEILPLARA
jgi:hypothetical protein